jgi:endonuclease/exonuclease/phosphatase (EEP) superfamily protein YafD
MRRLGCAALKCVWFVMGLYGAIVAAWLVLKTLGTAAWPPVELVSNLLPLLLLPVLVLFPVCVLFRRWRLAIITAPAMLIFLFGYGGMFVPRSVQAAPQVSDFHVLTYNLHAEPVRLQPMLDVIRNAKADIVALQELSPQMAAALAAQLKGAYPYQALHIDDDSPLLGQGVLSRYPIVEDDYWQISLGHQRVKIDRNGTALVLYNVHPVHPFLLHDGYLFNMQPHRTEVDEILRRAAQDTGTVIIAGDFNMTDQADDYRRLAQQYRDAYRAVGWGLGLTFPDCSYACTVPVNSALLKLVGRPLARIDFIFHSDDLRPLSARVWPTSGGSDHRPVLVEFAAGSPDEAISTCSFKRRPLLSAMIAWRMPCPWRQVL